MKHIAKTQNPFPMIEFDQNHEQQNKELNVHGGTLNLSDECVFTEWAVAGPDIARVITEFEAGMLTLKNSVLKHHEQPQQKQACEQHQGRHAHTIATIQVITMHVREDISDRLFELENADSPIKTWRPKKWPKVGLAILLGSRLSIRL